MTIQDEHFKKKKSRQIIPLLLDYVRLAFLLKVSYNMF